jgi:hypothetical protein
MPRLNSKIYEGQPQRRLYFDNIKLVPVDNGEYPYTRYPNSWHVPGWPRWATTKQLAALARKRNVSLILTESRGATVSQTRLN